MKSAEEILANEFNCSVDELQLTIQLNPDKDKILNAMNAFSKYKVAQSRHNAVRKSIVKSSSTWHRPLMPLDDPFGYKEDSSESRATKDWLKKVINSCTNTIHFEYAQVLVDLFKEKCKHEDEYIEVQDYYNHAFNAVHFVIK
jgi:hypothetical protein